MFRDVVNIFCVYIDHKRFKFFDVRLHLKILSNKMITILVLYSLL